MKHIFFVPVKAVSERVPGKNFKPVPQFDNAPLYQILPLKIAKVCAELNLQFQIVMDSDSVDAVEDWVSRLNTQHLPSHMLSPIGAPYPSSGTFLFRKRPAHLCNNAANGNYILREGVKWLFNGKMEEPPNLAEEVVIWQAFVTTPLLSEKTITHLIGYMDQALIPAPSVMTVEPHQGFFWDSNNTPIGGYRPEVMLPSQQMPKIYKEIHGMFGITLSEFRRLGCRTGQNPYFVEVPKEECVDIDWPEDLEKLGKVAPTPPRMEEIEQYVVSKAVMDALDKYRPKPGPITGDQNDPR